MKLLIAADIFPPQSGGPATYSVALANALTEAGDDVRIVSLNPASDAKHVTCNLYHVTKRNKIFRYFEYFRLVLKYAKDVDVVYAMGPVNAGLPALIAAKLHGKKFVTKVVGDYAWEQGVQRFGVEDLIDEFQKKNNYGLIVRLLKMIESFVVKKADKVIVPSEYLKGIVVGWGADEKKVVVIYNAVDFKAVDPAPKPEGERWIVSVGRLVPWKGMGTLIETMPELIKEMPDIRLKIVGDGPIIEELRMKVRDLRLDDFVELTGALSHEETLSYIATSDVFVLNSAYEGLSHVLLEALSYNKPVLASNAGGNPEIIKSGKTGELFEYNDKKDINDKLDIVLKNTMVINPFLHSKNREDWFNNFTYKKMFLETTKILEAV